MPVVQVSVWEGMTAENKKKTVEGITKVFVDLGVPTEAVEIVIYEAPKSNWATGGNCIQKDMRTRPPYKTITRQVARQCDSISSSVCSSIFLEAFWRDYHLQE
jgi:4-oxalocrotonate tautomerase